MVWLGLAATTGTVTATFVQVFRGRLHPLSLPVLAAASFAFLYVWQPALLIANRKVFYFLDEAGVAAGLAWPALSLLLLILGWTAGARRQAPHAARGWDADRLYASGLMLSAVGWAAFYAFLYQSGGAIAFYSSPHGAAGAWEEQTAWVYFGRYLSYPGLVLMLLGRVRGRRDPYWAAPIAIVVALNLIHAVLTGSRGTIFPLAVAVAFPPYLARRESPRLLSLVMGAGVLGLTVLLLVGYRAQLHLGERAAQVPRLAEALLATSDVPDEGIRDLTTGVEFLYHAGIIETVDAYARYNLFADLIHTLTVHPVPRLLWPSKPYYWNLGVTADDVAERLGWRRASGAAFGLVADLYRQVGPVSVVLWWAAGFLGGRQFRRAAAGEDVETITLYCLAYGWSLHLFTQDFRSMLIPFAYVAVPALAALRFARRPADSRRPVRGGHEDWTSHVRPLSAPWKPAKAPRP